MNGVRVVVIYLLLLLSLVSCLQFEAGNALLSSEPKGDSCKSDLECGSNIKYEFCRNTDSSKNDTKCGSNDKNCVCSYCHSDSDCDVNKQNDYCNDNHWCEMNKLTKNFDGSTIATIIAIFVGAFIAAGGGLGGGGIFVPVFILLLDFDAKSAAALSQATIAGGSIVNLIMNFREYHPNPDRSHRPLTDFNTILILEPMLLGGTVFGVLLNEILPDPIILVCLILVLTIALYRMIKKGRSQWAEENRKKAEEKAKQSQLEHDDTNINSMTGAANSRYSQSTKTSIHMSYTIDIHIQICARINL